MARNISRIISVAIVQNNGDVAMEIESENEYVCWKEGREKLVTLKGSVVTQAFYLKNISDVIN